MQTKIDRHRTHRVLGLGGLALLMAMAVYPSRIHAQSLNAEPLRRPPEREKVDTSDYTLRAYKLKHISDSLVSDLIQITADSQSKMRVKGDDKGNIFVYGDDKLHLKVADLIKQFDQPDEEPAVQVYFLQYLAAREALDVSEALAGDLTVVADPRMNALVAKGSQESIDNLKALLSQIDRQAEVDQQAKASAGSYRVTLYWLAESDDDEASEVSKEISDVVEILESRDFKPLAQLGMNEIQVKSGGRFQIGGSVPGGSMEVQGRLEPSDGEAMSLQFDFTVVRETSPHQPGGGRNTAAQISTEIETPLGHNIILGVVGANPDKPDVRNVIVVRIDQ